MEKVMADMYKNVDGKRIKMTSEEVAQRQADDKAYADDAPNRKLAKLRNDRVPLLQEADYKINTLVDNGEDASAWRKYRQDLRDITKAEDLDNVTFPTKPS
tara:strand:+ start:1206 stop:1508 length:303 start_codon:yes stop_codon:yes gene_type:complete